MSNNYIEKEDYVEVTITTKTGMTTTRTIRVSPFGEILPGGNIEHDIHNLGYAISKVIMPIYDGPCGLAVLAHAINFWPTTDFESLEKKEFRRLAEMISKPPKQSPPAQSGPGISASDQTPS